MQILNFDLQNFKGKFNFTQTGIENNYICSYIVDSINKKIVIGGGSSRYFMILNNYDLIDTNK